MVLPFHFAFRLLKSVIVIRHFFPNRNLFLLWSGQWVSLTGDYVYRIGLYWWVLAVSGSTVQTGLLGACFFLPTLLFGLHAGAVADRSGYRKTMAAADLFRLALVLAVAGAFALGSPPAWLLLAIAFGVAAGGAFFNPARDALIPELAPGSALVRINAAQQSAWPLSLLIGAILARLTIDRPVMLFGFDALTFLASLACIVSIAHRWGGARCGDSPRALRWGDLAAGLRYAIRDKRILVLLILTSIDNLFIMGPAEVGLAIFVRDRLGLGGESYALVESAYGFGMLLSMLLIHRYADRLSNGKLVLWGMVFDGLTFIPMYWCNSFAATYIVFFIHSWAIPMIIVGRAALIQSIVPEGIRGRVFSLVNITVNGMVALSSAIIGLAATTIPIHVLFAIIGIGGGLCGLAGMLYRPLRECE